jgi:exodeoxyribonuclease V
LEFTKGQNEALQAIDTLHKSNPNGGGVLVINGYAGVGKTTLIKSIADEAGDILVLAPTGKAALRVRDVAFCRSSTIHRWLYVADEDEVTGEVFFRKKSWLEIEEPKYHSLIIDEASMINKEIWEDVHDAAINLGLNVILIGDEFQLPPVETKPEENFSVFGPQFTYDARVNLTEVLRQTLENPIIKAATALRTGNNYTLELSSLPMVDKAKLMDEAISTWSSDGVIICHRNETRHDINDKIRKELKRIGQIESKEPVLVTKNNYHLDIFNGEVFAIKNVIGSIGFKQVKDRFQNRTCWVDFLRVELQNGDQCIIGQQELDNKSEGIGFKFIEGVSKQLSRPLAKKEGLVKNFIPHIHANYGYTLTCHKSQGSEWNDVLILAEPSVKITTYPGRRWLYTALTRARKNVKLCWY